MFALGQKQTSDQVRVMSALPPKADMVEHGRDGRRKFRPFNNLTVKRPQTPPPQINDLAAFRKMISRATLPQIGTPIGNRFVCIPRPQFALERNQAGAILIPSDWGRPCLSGRTGTMVKASDWLHCPFDSPLPSKKTALGQQGKAVGCVPPTALLS